MTQTELQSASSYNNLRCQTILSKCIDAIRLFHGLVKPSADENWMRDGSPVIGVGYERTKLTPVRTNAGTSGPAPQRRQILGLAHKTRTSPAIAAGSAFALALGASRTRGKND